MTDAQQSWVQETQQAVYKLIAETPPKGKQFAETIRTILKVQYPPRSRDMVYNGAWLFLIGVEDTDWLKKYKMLSMFYIFGDKTIFPQYLSDHDTLLITYSDHCTIFYYQ